jgi:hypothetical protein
MPDDAEIVRATLEPFTGVNVAAIDWSDGTVRDRAGVEIDLTTHGRDGDESSLRERD